MSQNITISSQFDSGNIKVLAVNSANDIQLEINKDNHSDFFQWFHFKLHSTVEFYALNQDVFHSYKVQNKHNR